MNKPANSVPISKVIANQIEKSILDGELIPQQKIPSERRLSTRFGVSRSIVREALRDLLGRGLIDTRQGMGSFVVDLVPEVKDDSPLMQSFFGNTRTLYDLYEVREQLEGQAAFLAAKRGSRQDFYQITKAFHAMELTEPGQAAEWDHAFHRAIVAASHNAVLVHVLSSLDKMMLHSVEICVNNLSGRRKEQQQIEKHHRQIYYAIINRQAQWAQKAATAHIRYVCEQLRRIEESDESIRQTET